MKWDTARSGGAGAALLAGALGALMVAGLGVLGSALANETAPTVLADSCQECHGTNGNSPADIPSIAGLEAAALEAALIAFKTDTDATIMGRISRGYTDAEIKALAAEIAGWTAQ